jgi:hypothetical protein
MTSSSLTENMPLDYVGFRFQITYKDEHLLKVRISAWNGSFGGGADVYADADQLKDAAKQLQRFPLDPSDVREVTFGEFGPKSAGGGVSMRFYCADRAGHTYVDSKIESSYDSAGKAQSVFMTLTIEPAAVDSFVDELGRLGANQEGQACLNGVTRETRSVAGG